MMIDRIVLAKALAASKVNVRGTGKSEHAEPRAAEEADRTPNWNMWRHMPELPVWQCVALSLNIDPDRVRVVTWNWYGYPHLHEIDPDKARLALWDWRGNPVFDEGREFDDRLYIARENLHRTLHCQRVGADSPLLSRVSLRLFAAWVRQIGRDAPAALLAMADEQVASAGAPPAEQPTPAEAQRPQHDKPKTLARNEGWQARINELARSSPGKSHAHYCRTLAKEDKRISPRTIARLTKPPPS